VLKILVLMGLLFLAGANVHGVERYPPPQIDDPEYVQPTMTEPHAVKSNVYVEWFDVAVLVAALGAAAFFALKLRSRTAMILLTVFSLAYFGFWRAGCICPIGAIHHVTLSLVDPAYPLPMTVALFFAVPLVFALLFGRVFCSGVCPLGAIQDLVLIKPVKVPMWLEHVLWVVPFAYLGAAVLFTVTGTAFIICRYDPFVSFFRLSGPTPMLVFGGLMLVLATFVGRPYCRYLCPYRVLLSLGSRNAWRHATITPDECVVCALCEDACPFNAIEPPIPQGAEEE
jgi:polyferredoxin